VIYVLIFFIGKADVYSQNIGKKIKEVNTVCVSENNIWLGTNAGLVRRNIDNNLFVTVFNTTNSGIISNRILSIENDSKNIWIGTDRGLSKFDGYSWESFTPDQDFHQLKILDIAIGESQLWLGTNEGLWTYKEGHIRRVFRAQYDNQDIPKLFIDKEKTLWFIGKGEKEGLYKIKDNKLSKITIPKHIAIDFPIIEEASGILWFCGNGGIIRYEEDQWKKFSSESFEKQVKCGFLKKDLKNNLWFNVNNVVGKVNIEKQIVETFKMKQNNLFDIFFDNENNQYILGEKGIRDIKNEKNTHFPDHLKPQNHISSHLLINERNLLVFKNELYYCEKGILSEVIVDTTLKTNVILEVNEDKDQGVFIGTKHGVTLLKDGKTIHFKVPVERIRRFIDSAVYGFPKLPSIQTYNESIYDDSRKCYWVSTDSLYKLFNKKWENQGISTIRKYDRNPTVFLDKENRVWVFGSDSCVYHRNENKWIKYSPGKELLDNKVISYITADTTVSIIYNTGASVYSKGAWKKYPTDLISNMQTMFSDSEILWGDKLKEKELIVYNKGFWIRKKFSNLSGANNQILGTFKIDTTGTYIVTSQWVIKMSGKDYDIFFEPNSDTEKINCFTTDGSERIIFGMTNGLSLWTGKFWISLEAEDGLLSNHITGLYLTSKNLLLVSHSAGISTLDLNIYK
jgi:ligand-binding sensor domain-containing protein